MKISYLLCTSLLIGFVAFALPYDIKVDTSGITITEKTITVSAPIYFVNRAAASNGTGTLNKLVQFAYET